MTGRYDELGFYHDPRDDRLIVPKRDPDMGWTINLSHPHGHLALYAVWAAALLPMIVGLAVLSETRFG